MTDDQAHGLVSSADRLDFRSTVTLMRIFTKKENKKMNN